MFLPFIGFCRLLAMAAGLCRSGCALLLIGQALPFLLAKGIETIARGADRKGLTLPEFSAGRKRSSDRRTSLHTNG